MPNADAGWIGWPKAPAAVEVEGCAKALVVAGVDCGLNAEGAAPKPLWPKAGWPNAFVPPNADEVVPPKADVGLLNTDGFVVARRDATGLCFVAAS